MKIPSACYKWRASRLWCHVGFWLYTSGACVFLEDVDFQSEDLTSQQSKRPLSIHTLSWNS